MKKQKDKPINGKKRMSGRRKLAIIMVIIIVVIGVPFTIAAIYVNQYYAPNDIAKQVLAQPNGVAVTETGDWLFFDGAGTDTAMVFYPGAKVDSAAYAPLMQQIAAGGVDCFVLKLPFRIAFLNMNAADKAVSQGQYRHYLIGGHSLGGVAAADYSRSHREAVSGLVLLASYPTAALPGDLPVLSVTGDRDGVLNREAYDKAKQYWNSATREVVIQGGNHAGFGSYGKQDGDNEATVTAQEQQAYTAQAVLQLAKEIQ